MTTRKKGDKWLTYDGVVALTKFSRRTIRRRIVTDRFPIPVKVGGNLRFVKREVFAWMETQENRRQSA